jgi:hypothetical protein
MLPSVSLTFTFNHVGQADEYGPTTGNYVTVQTAFDSRALENRVLINSIITVLEAITASASGADAIGCDRIYSSDTTSTQTIRGQLEKIKEEITLAVAGTITDDSIQNKMLAPDAKVGSLAVLDTTVQTTAVEAINEVLAVANDALSAAYIIGG